MATWRMVAMLAWCLVAMPAQAASLVVGVMEFANESGDEAWDPLGKGFQEMFLVDLAKAGEVDIVPRTKLLQKGAELGITPPAGAKDRRRLASQSGADFLLSGTFLVDGARMALRVELLQAATGKVVLEDRREGESEGFFELQKDALKASLKALEVTLTARERAETGRLHTADFLAFQDFSRGLEYFDAERYEASMRALRAATERDAEFSLARITLEAYRELIDTIKQKAAAVGVVRAEQERMQKLAQAGDAVEVIRRLLAIADRAGDAARRERLTALYLLSRAMSGDWRSNKALREYYAVEDRFAMRRASEQLAQRYHAEAIELWPSLPVKVTKEFARTFPTADAFDEEFAEAVTYLWEKGVDSANNRKSYLLDNLRYPREFAAQFHLTVEEEVAWYDRFLELGAVLEAPDWWVKNTREDMVKDLRWALRFDDSTRILQGFAEASENQYALKGFASQIEDNRSYVELLSKAKRRSWMEEWMRLTIPEFGQPGPVVGMGEEYFAGTTRTPKALYRLTDAREWPRRTFLYVDDVLVWMHQPQFYFHPGPMSDPRRTEEVRYHHGGSDTLDGILFLGAAPYASVDVGVTFDQRVPDDFWLDDDEQGVHDADPAVAVLVGLIDLDVPEARDPVTGDDHLSRPMRGVAVWVRDGELQIVQTVEAKRGSYERKDAFDEKVLASQSLSKLGPTFRIDVAVRDRTVVAKVGRRSVRASLPEAVRGYVGIQYRGKGFVAARDVALREGRKK